MPVIGKLIPRTNQALVNVMREIVADVSADVTATIQANDAAIRGKASLITGVHYEHGHILEIIETIQQKDNSNSHYDKIFPMVALLQDFPVEGGDFGTDGKARLHFIIANYTGPDYKAQDRQDKNFDPILYVIRDSFYKHISYHPFFSEYSVSGIRKTDIDRMFWGREGLAGVEGNVFNNWVDCIEIKDLQLKLARKTC